MSITKVTLTIEVPGAKVVRNKEPEVIPWVASGKTKQGKEWFKRGKVNHYGIKTVNARHHLNLSIDAYNYMVSSDCPSFSYPKEWKKLSPEQRLKKHLDRICSSLHGISYSYQILN